MYLVIFVARVIGIISGKGGVGKTTVALNLGAMLASRFNKNVTIVDCNVTTPHLSLFLGLSHSPKHLNAVLREESKIDDALHHHHTGMKILPSSLFLKDLDRADIMKLREKINEITHKNDIVILDAAPGLGREAMGVVRASDEIIYVTTPFIPSAVDVVKCNEVVKELNIPAVGVILNMVKSDKHELTTREVEYLTGLPIIGEIPHDKHVKRSLIMKLPVVVYRPRGKASVEIYKMSAALMGIPLRQSFWSKMRFW
jgi:septum site-determining protein MinD